MGIERYLFARGRKWLLEGVLHALGLRSPQEAKWISCYTPSPQSVYVLRSRVPPNVNKGFVALQVTLFFVKVDAVVDPVQADGVLVRSGF